MNNKEEKQWLWVGKIANKTLAKAAEMIHEGMPLLELAEKLENYIRGYAAPAFPVNISINHVAAHYSPKLSDESTIPKGSLVKIDVGVQKNGFIADTAITISFNPNLEDLAKASFEALINAEAFIMPNVNTGAIGSKIEKTITGYGFKPIKNLTGHKILRYNLHAGKTIPNTKTIFGDKVFEGEVYAIEPFATNGTGYVVESNEGYIYRVISVKRTGDKYMDSVLREMWKRFKSLPFSERWLTSFVSKEKIKDVLRWLLSKKAIMVYPILVEKKKGYVSQFEDTVIVTNEGPIITTNVAKIVKEYFY